LVILMMSALVEGRLLRADIFSPSLRAYQKDCGKKVRRPSLLQPDNCLVLGWNQNQSSHLMSS